MRTLLVPSSLLLENKVKTLDDSKTTPATTTSRSSSNVFDWKDLLFPWNAESHNETTEVINNVMTFMGNSSYNNNNISSASAQTTTKNTVTVSPVVTSKTTSITKNVSDFERELDHLIDNTTFRYPHQSMFGFFYQAYKRPKATLEVIKSSSMYMPRSPIYLVSSGGYHYDPLEQRFPNVHFVYDTMNVDLHKGGKLDRWFEWIKAAALWCNCEYLVLLEDDTFLRRPLTQRPPYDAGGIHAAAADFTWPSILKEKFGFNYTHYGYGMCGGSYVRTEAFLEAHSRLNWTRIFDMRNASDERFGIISDMTLALVMMDSGYVLKPWKQVTNKYWKDSAMVDILHNEKRYYTKKLSRLDGAVISDRLSQNESAMIRDFASA